MTVEKMLNELVKPENANQIKHLAELKNYKPDDDAKEGGGLTGRLSKFTKRFSQKHMDALLVLSQCETRANIAEFKETEHYRKIKNLTVGADNLEKLSELKNLKS